MIYYDWEVIEVRKRRWSGGQGGICLPVLYNHQSVNKLVSLSRGGKEEALEGKDYKTDRHCFSLLLISGSLSLCLWLSLTISLSLSFLILSLLTDSQLCMLELRDLLLQENKYLYYYNLDSRVVSYSVMMFVRKKLPQQTF